MSYRDSRRHQSERPRSSRWGDSRSSNDYQRRGDNRGGPPQRRPHENQQQRRPENQPTKEVTDEDALKALLASANQRKQEKEQQQKQMGRQDRNGPPRNGDDRNKRPASSRDGDDHGDKSRGRGPPYERGEKRHRADTSSEGGKGNYYGPAGGAGDGNPPGDDETTDEKAKPKVKANFGLSGALMKDEGGGGNVYKGIVLKFREPPEARAPNTQWRFYVFKDKDLVETLHISKQSAYLMGRNADICDIPMHHGSLSSQHAVLQYRALPTKQDPTRVACHPYIMDLESTNGTHLNGVKIDAARYYQLKKGDVLTFGASTREFVVMTENTTSVK